MLHAALGAMRARLTAVTLAAGVIAAFTAGFKFAMPSLQPVILSGGSGTRLWPLSRRAFPKQFLALVDDDTLLQSTAARLDSLAGKTEVSAPLVVCNEDHRFLVAEQLRASGHAAAKVLLEPKGRNTAPALTLAALRCEQDDPVMIVMPADHVVRDGEAFARAVAAGLDHAMSGKVVTFGIVPSSPIPGLDTSRRVPQPTRRRLHWNVSSRSQTVRPPRPTSRLGTFSGTAASFSSRPRVGWH
jgi:hypothetical protein